MQAADELPARHQRWDLADGMEVALGPAEADRAVEQAKLQPVVDVCHGAWKDADRQILELKHFGHGHLPLFANNREATRTPGTESGPKVSNFLKCLNIPRMTMGDN